MSSARAAAVWVLSTTLATAAPGTESKEWVPRLVDEAPSTSQAGRNLERFLSETVRQDEVARAELDHLSKQATLAYGRTVARGRAYVRLARAGLLPVAGGFEAVIAHAARLERLRRGIEQDVELDRQLSRRRVELAAKLQEVGLRRESLEAEQRALVRAESALLAEQERRAAFDRAFLPAGRTEPSVYGTPASEGPLGARLNPGFASFKGRFPFPVAGRVELVPVRLRTARVGGVELRCSRGMPVRAVHGGRVAFADSYADYGRAVILDHGAGYYTLTGLLGSLDVRVGDPVRAGTRLGVASDWDAQARVYFEVRVGTQTVDAVEWLGLAR